MKAGVLTFHRATNYGTALQAYATARVFQKMGIETELIDYRPEYIERTLRERKLLDSRSVKMVASILLNKMIYGEQMRKKIGRFQEFIGTMPVSAQRCESLPDVERIAHQYDIVISGSDQLWNEKITGKDMMYFLPFPHPKKISYASSFGVGQISDLRKEEILPYLSDFYAISVREKTAKKMLSEILTKASEDAPPVYRVIDPTLLLDKEEWIQEAEVKVDLPEEGYILTYYMIETPILRAINDRLKTQTGLPVVNIKPSKRQILLREGINIMWAGPREFLHCYSGAKYVVTNSFHGTAFAVNFEIPMYVAPLPVSMAGEVNSRLIDILEWYGLTDRWINSLGMVEGIDATVDRISLKEIKYFRKAESQAIIEKMIGSEINEQQ